MEDVRTRRGADMASDHHLVVAKMKLKLKNIWTTGQTALPRFNIAFLKDADKLNEFKIALNNRFQALQDLLKEEETTMEDEWGGYQRSINSNVSRGSGPIKERRNTKTTNINSRIRAEKIIAQAEYIKVNKQVKESNKANKKKCVEELATTTEKASRVRNMKQLYDTTKKLAEKYSKPERPVKDKEGRPITETQEQRNRWVEYFEGLLNRPAPMNTPNIEAAHTSLPTDVNLPTTEEIRMAIRQIKSGKAAGPGNIPAEALKSNVEVTTNMLHLLFRKIWKEGQVSMDWKEGLLNNISKKGDQSKFENYTTDHL
ncbi:unnamed protein product [Schistosoma mattheei]|uniref:Uncharacterized protein n=1 Tax=Schistosoma mattheei TaxID=31246 RepID=A0A183Q617_9TREM|nr:unnamed protein product [Schistosoma mattheei]